MRVAVTGADGFVGRWLVRALHEARHEVAALVRPAMVGKTPWRDVARGDVPETALELTDAGATRAALVAAGRVDAVVHLAAVASGKDALADPAAAWAVNAGGTQALLEAVDARGDELAPRVLVVSSAEVYGGPAECRPLTEQDPVAPRSPYAASKAAAEFVAQCAGTWGGLPVIVARPFPHTGPGQDERFVVPAFARRLRDAARSHARVVKVGNLEPVRDLLDVRDVARAYIALLERGMPGETYNVASGTGTSLAEVFRLLAALLAVDARAEPDAALMRPADLPYLVGDATKLRDTTGWRPAIPLDQTLQDLVDAQAD